MKDFQTLAIEWLDSQMQLFQQAIAKRKGDYLKKKWPWTESAASDFNRRLEELTAIHASLLTELTFGKRYGENLLNLANIVFNEAGKASRPAKVAIAYAWLNRTKGVMREPELDEISKYRPLLVRWNKLNDTERMTFLPNFADSLSAARQRLSDPEPTKNDPTQGADHWVSPAGLDAFNVKDTSRYSRTVGSAKNRAFPKWARGVNDPEVVQMKKRRELSENYAELALPGIPQTEFLFYVGVK